MPQASERMTNYRWTICILLFFATTINYMDRQVLSLTWSDYLVPEFHWTNTDYGTIVSIFSFAYAISMLFAGRLIDWLDTRKGFAWAIVIWSLGACLHAFCGIATAGYIGGNWFLGFGGAKQFLANTQGIAQVVTVSVTTFVFARIVLAIGEAGNFPAAIKTTAEYFPKKDRAFATSIFNAGATVGALLAPVSIPFIAEAWGWETSFLIIGGLGFLWLGFWLFGYKKPESNPHVNVAELAYIKQDDELEKSVTSTFEASQEKMSLLATFGYKQTWAFAVGKFMTDGVWWFFLYWTPNYLKSVYGLSAAQSAPQLFVLYLITLLSIIGGWLPTFFVDKKGMNPYQGRMFAMLIFAFFPLLALFAQPLGHISVWIPVIIIGIAGAAHQSWSANIFSTVGDMFPKAAIATVTGIGGMAGGLGSVLINYGSGKLFDYTKATDYHFMNFHGIEAGYFIVFIFCACAYLIGWVIMKALVPRYKPVVPV